MNLREALLCLGATQVIWIDDHFSDTPKSVTTMLVNDRDTALACGFGFLDEALERVDEDQEGATADIEQALTDLMGRDGRDGLLAVRDAFLRQSEAAGAEPKNEMSVDTVQQTCRILAIAEADRWGFDGVEEKLRRVRDGADGDGHVAYMVDLRDGNDSLRGLEILKLLARMGSQATAFILTHETGADKEAEREGILHDELRAEDALAIPLCVISKQRLKGEPDAGAGATEAKMVEALRVAIKRAGLRRSVHEVLRHAREDIAASTGMAAQSLLLVSPEHLDAHVVEVSYEEGMSELHVIERALTARIAQRLRHLFATKPEVRASSARLRQLREIPLSLRSADLDDALTDFHKAEVWEDGELLNVGHAPIACGEVFMTDPDEKATAAGKPKRFVLLAQPCDVAIRSDGKRAVETGVLVPLKAVDGTTGKPDGKKPSDKDYRLPVMLDGEILTCHMREAVPVRLSILDLASFRADGRVRVDQGAAPPADGLLPGLAAAFAARTKAALDLMAAAAGPDGPEKQAALLAHQEDLQLLLAAPDIFKHVRRGVHEKATSVKDRGVTTVTPERVTWRLRRCGRIRMPYAADLLDRYVYTVNRSAFDVDYVARGLKASAPAAALAEAPAAGPAATNGAEGGNGRTGLPSRT